MVIHQMMDQSVMSDFSSSAIHTCWKSCYHDKLTRKGLVDGDLLKFSSEQSMCQKRCIDRFFEVYGFLGEARERREQEQQMGLPPGSIPAK